MENLTYIISNALTFIAGVAVGLFFGALAWKGKNKKGWIPTHICNNKLCTVIGQDHEEYYVIVEYSAGRREKVRINEVHSIE